MESESGISRLMILLLALFVIAASLVPLLLVARSIWVLRGTLNPLVDGCDSISCLGGVEADLLFDSWVAEHGLRLRSLNVVLLDVLGGIGFLGGSFLLWKENRRVVVAAGAVFVVLLAWQGVHLGLIDEADWIFT